MHRATDYAKKFSEVHPLPGVVSTITRLIDDPDSTMRQFEEVIQTDPVLVIRLIGLVNSSYYGLNQKFTSISRAVAFLGMRNLHSLVVTDAVKDIFKKPNRSSRPRELPPQALTGRVEGWRGTQKPVSNLRLDKPSVRISRTRLSLLITTQGL